MRAGPNEAIGSIYKQASHTYSERHLKSFYLNIVVNKNILITSHVYVLKRKKKPFTGRMFSGTLSVVCLDGIH